MLVQSRVIRVYLTLTLKQRRPFWKMAAKALTDIFSLDTIANYFTRAMV